MSQRVIKLGLLVLALVVTLSSINYAVTCNTQNPDPTPPACLSSYQTCASIESGDLCTAGTPTCNSQTGSYPEYVAKSCEGGGQKTEHCDDAGSDVICYEVWRCFWDGLNCEKWGETRCSFHETTPKTGDHTCNAPT